MFRVLLFGCSIFQSFCIISWQSGTHLFVQMKMPDHISKVVREIEEVNVVMGKAVYYSGQRPKLYDHFMHLKRIATQDELAALTDHPNATVRCYAFWALSQETNFDVYPIILKHINDNEYVSTQFGCLGGRLKVGDFFISRALEASRNPIDNIIDPELLSRIDLVLLYTPNELSTKNAAIRRAPLSEKLYPRLRELYLLENNQEVLVKLAEFQKEQDILLIKNHRWGDNGYHYAYGAISKFPHPTFFPLLEDKFHALLEKDKKSRAWSSLYRALVNYKNDKVLELLRKSLEKFKHDHVLYRHREYLSNAFDECNSSFYDVFRKEHSIWTFK